MAGPGHDAALNPVKNWDLDALAGAGAIRSTTNDMLKFMAANVGLTATPLKPAMERMRAVRQETGVPHVEIAMAGHLFRISTRSLLAQRRYGGLSFFCRHGPCRQRKPLSCYATRP